MFGVEDKKCKRCGKAMDSFDYDWGNGFCDSCHNRRIFFTGLIVAIVSLVIFIPLGYVSYNYNLEKCDNLRLSETDYGFSHSLELNAEYNEATERPAFPKILEMINTLAISPVVSFCSLNCSRTAANR